MQLSNFKFYIVIMSLLMSLSSSSFFLDKYLNEAIFDKSYNDAQLNFAIKNKLVSALNLVVNNTERGSHDWIVISKELAKTQKSSALALADWYQSLAEQEKRLSKQAILWFEQAIRLNSSMATLKLSQYYYQYDAVVKARDTIAALHYDDLSIMDNATARALQIKINIYLGERNQVIEQIQSLSTKVLRSSEVSTLLSDIKRFKVLEKYTYSDAAQELPKLNPQHQGNDIGTNCISSVQLFATNLKHLWHIQGLIKSFKEQQALAQFICLPEPKYISSKYLDCIEDKAAAITCDEALWAVLYGKTNTRHIGLMLNNGGANVHLGILYFDSQDDVNVLSHELSHLLGFVDEYPLVKGHDICQHEQSNSFSHNIAVIPKHYIGERAVVREKVLASIPWAKWIRADTAILQAVRSKQSSLTLWEVGTPVQFIGEVGLYKAETCQQSTKEKLSILKNNISAFKPIYQRSQLRTLTSEFPEIYVNMLEAQPTSYLMPSYYYNIALAYYQKGDINKAKLWLSKAAQWEVDPVRKKRIVKGAF